MLLREKSNNTQALCVRIDFCLFVCSLACLLLPLLRRTHRERETERRGICSLELEKFLLLLRPTWYFFLSRKSRHKHRRKDTAQHLASTSRPLVALLKHERRRLDSRAAREVEPESRVGAKTKREGDGEKLVSSVPLCRSLFTETHSAAPAEAEAAREAGAAPFVLRRQWSLVVVVVAQVGAKVAVAVRVTARSVLCHRGRGRGPPPLLLLLAHRHERANKLSLSSNNPPRPKWARGEVLRSRAAGQK